MENKPTAADEVSKSDVEWQETLSPQEYRVLRQRGTEPAWSHPFNEEHREGHFLCAGCGAPLFSSDARAPQTRVPSTSRSSTPEKL